MNRKKNHLEENPDYVEIVEELIKYEEENKEPDHPYIDDTEFDCCWESKDVHIHPQKLYQLEVKGFLERVMDTQSTTAYSIINREKIKEMLDDLEFDEGKHKVMHDFPDPDELPDGIFDDVIGYEDVKWILKRGITQDKIVNFLLVGPPGSAKTVFLLCLRDFGDSVFVSAGKSSSPGYVDAIFTEKPKYLLIDELDDMDPKDQDGLSDFTDTGILSETKHGKTREMVTNTKTFASANSMDDIHENIQQRFVDLHFDPYIKEEFIEICEHLLTRKEDCTEEEARDIGEAVWEIDGSGNVRKALSVARLSNGDPKRVLSVLEDYSAGDSSLERKIGI